MTVTPCPLSVDASFGPWAGRCRGGFDFTRFFEETILLIPCSTLLLLASLLRITLLLRRRRIVVNTRLLFFKLTLFVLLAIVNLALLVLVARQNDFRTSASIAAYTLRFITGPALMALSYFEHIYTLRPSTLICVYLLVLLLLDSAHMRTLALEFPHGGPTIAFGVSIGFEVFSFLAECVQKKETVGVSFASLSPETTSNLFVRQTFLWLSKILRIGYSRTITTRDLYNLDAAMGSEKLARSFRKLGLDKNGHATDRSLVLESLWKLRWAILAALPGRLCTTAFTFAQPFLLIDTTTLAALPVTKETNQQGYGLIGAFIFVYLGMAFAGCQYQYKITRVMTMLRGGLVGLIYERSMRLSPKDQAKANAALTHMSTDVELITSAAFFLHELWACPLEVAIGIWLIERQLGVACLIPIVIAIIAGSVTVLITARVNSAQTAWVSKMTQRVGSTGVTLNSAAGLKLSNLLDKAMRLLQDIREDELRISKPFRKLMIVNMLLGYFTPIISPVFTFLVFALVNRSNPNSVFTVERAFSSLTLLYIVATPMTQIITMAPVCIVALNSFKRVDKYCKVHEKPAEEHSRASKDERMLLAPQHNGDAHSLIEFQGPGYDQIALDLRQAQFSWTPDTTAEVDGVDLVASKGAFVLIVGPTGSGKSTILKALVGEVPDVSGIEHMMPGPIGYCAQTPWLPAGTAREVILGGSQFEPDWYETVVKACQLKFDFRLWHRGDRNQIGSNGAALSGGQRQRLAMARCIYSKAKLMLFDDSLRGLDIGTKQAVFERVFGPGGLLRELGTTILLVSSSREYSDFADQTLTLGPVPEVPRGESVEASASGSSQDPTPLTSSSHEVLPKLEVAEKDEENEATIAVPAEEEEAVNEQESKAKDEADYNRRFGASGSYKYYIKPVAWSALIYFTTFILIFTFCQAFPSVWLKMWSQFNTKHPGGQLGKYLGVYSALGAGALISLVIACWEFFVNMIPRTGSFFHQVLVDTVVHAPVTDLSSTEAGDTTSRFSQDLQLIDTELPLATMNTFAAATMCISSAVIIGVAGKYVAIAFPVCIGILVMIQRFYLRTSRQLRFLDLETKGPLYSRFLECSSGLSTIQAFGWQEHYEKNQWHYLDMSQRAYYMFHCLQRWLTVTIDLVVGLFAILLAVVLIELRSSIGGGFIAVGLVNILSFNGQLKALIMHWTSMEISMGAVARIRGFAQNTVNEDEGVLASEAPKLWPSIGALRVHNLRVSYGKSHTPALDRVSFHINPGEKIAICGRTGSGKSTLMLCLLRMLDPESGSTIFIDDIDIGTLSRQSVRSAITFVSQEPTFIMDSVRTNLDPSGTASDDALVLVLTKAGLWDIVQAAGGLDMTPMPLLPLSPGQKQLFVLARAILHPRRIVLLDEPTAAVDEVTATRLKELMRIEFSDSTVVNIAHRLESISEYDKVLILSKGSMVAFGKIGDVGHMLQNDFS